MSNSGRLWFYYPHYYVPLGRYISDPILIEADCGFIIPTIMSLWEDTSVTLYNSLHSKG